jgi:hypothetical protein
MATLANIVQTYSQKGQAEDFQEAIYNVTPWETPVMSAIGRSKAKAKVHRWQTDDLKGATTNAQLEGDEIGTSDLTAITANIEVFNYAQITRKVIGVTGTMDAVDKYGRASETAYQVAKGMKELKVDIDFAICRNQAGTAGATGTARTSGGMEAWIQSNQFATTNGSTTGGFTTTGSINASADTTTTVMVYTETALKNVITTIWNAAGGSPDMIALSGKNKALMSNTTNFPGVATRFRDVNAGAQAQIISGVDLFVSDFGTHKIVPSRQVRDRTVLVLNTDYWSTAFLRPFQTIELAKTGDHERRMLLAEWTLVSKNEKASGKLPNLSTT